MGNIKMKSKGTKKNLPSWDQIKLFWKCVQSEETLILDFSWTDERINHSYIINIGKDDLFMISVQKICETCCYDYRETKRAGKEIDSYDDCCYGYFHNMQLIW